jgi:hypothetical protein
MRLFLGSVSKRVFGNVVVRNVPRPALGAIGGVGELRSVNNGPDLKYLSVKLLPSYHVILFDNGQLIIVYESILVNFRMIAWMKKETL